MKKQNEAFNYEFCLDLEAYLCEYFSKTNIKELKYFWCDGVLDRPYYNDDVNIDYLSAEKIMIRQNIVTTAYVGESGQDLYSLTLKFGNLSLEAYQNNKKLTPYLPEMTISNNLVIDIENKTLQIHLK